jgi:hypothetical protein
VQQLERHKLLGGLGSSELSQLVSVLAMRHGFQSWMPTWDIGRLPGGRNSFSYATALTGAGGSTALSAEVFLALPNSSDSSVVACAEVLVGDRDAWGQVDREDGRLAPEPREQLALEDLFEFAATAWQMTAEELPASLSTGTSALWWSGVPATEIRFSVEHPHNHNGPRRVLTDFVDLTAFGQRRGTELTEMGVTVFAPPTLKREVRRAVARQALVRMGHDYGFLAAEESAF